MQELSLNFLLLEKHHHADVLQLLDDAFGTKRHQRAINRRRKDYQPIKDYCFVGYLHNRLVAVIHFYAVKIIHHDIQSDIIPFLGPLAVLPQYAGQGIGRKISAYALDIVKKSGMKASMLIGDPERYQHYGFNCDCVSNIDFGDDTAPLALMGMEFELGYLKRQYGRIIFV